MKYYTNTNRTTVYAYAADGSEDGFIPLDLIAVSDAEADEIRYPFPDLVLAKIDSMKNARNNAIDSGVTSVARGSSHFYATQSENRNFLNNLITLGNGGKFTCTDPSGVKARLPHTHAQLVSLAHDIEAHVSAQFDRYELKVSEILNAADRTALSAIDWESS